MVPPPLRIGIDLGGTKIAAIGLGDHDEVVAERRVATPRNDYPATLAAIGALVVDIERSTGRHGTVGVGMPGSLSPRTGLVQNANSTWLNGRPFNTDLSLLLGRRVACANDANCFALSEAADGAGVGARVLFGVILGTGCGGGIVVDGRIVDGPRGIGGEWGHNPLPWPTVSENPGPHCWCGRRGCMETWVSGPALAADYARMGGSPVPAETIVARSHSGDALAVAAIAAHAGRLARGLAQIVNILDPDVIVLGGGLSALPHLYVELPNLMAPYLFADSTAVAILPPRWGDASGVRGAARLLST